MSYSQGDEEATILKRFMYRVPGRLLDIGAAGALELSNSRALLDLGWSGVLVDASPQAAISMLNNCEVFGDRVDVIQACIGLGSHIVRFWNAPGLVSSTDEAHIAKWSAKGDKKFQLMHMPQITPDDLLKQFPGPYEFLNVDVEGISVDVLKAFPIEALRPECICVEHDGRYAELIDWAMPMSYKPIYRDGNNLILAT